MEPSSESLTSCPTPGHLWPSNAYAPWQIILKLPWWCQALMVGCDTRTASVTVVGLEEAVPFREVYICAGFCDRFTQQVHNFSLHGRKLFGPFKGAVVWGRLEMIPYFKRSWSSGNQYLPLFLPAEFLILSESTQRLTFWISLAL